MAGESVLEKAMQTAGSAYRIRELSAAGSPYRKFACTGSWDNFLPLKRAMSIGGSSLQKAGAISGVLEVVTAGRPYINESQQ